MRKEFLNGKTVLVLNSHELVCLRALCLSAAAKLNGRPPLPLPIELGERRRFKQFLRELLDATDEFFEGDDWKFDGVEREEIEEVWREIGDALQQISGPVGLGYQPD